LGARSIQRAAPAARHLNFQRRFSELHLEVAGGAAASRMAARIMVWQSYHTSKAARSRRLSPSDAPPTPLRTSTRAGTRGPAAVAIVLAVSCRLLFSLRVPDDRCPGDAQPTRTLRLRLAGYGRTVNGAMRSGSTSSQVSGCARTRALRPRGGRGRPAAPPHGPQRYSSTPDRHQVQHLVADELVAERRPSVGAARSAVSFRRRPCAPETGGFGRSVAQEA